MMINKQNFLYNLWDDFSIYFDKDNVNFNLFDDLVLSNFLVGEYFYYFVNPLTLKLYNVKKNVTSLLSLKDIPKSISEILTLAHPEDIEFISDAEEWGFDKLITSKNIDQYKIGYIVRLKVSEDKYDFFYHQTHYTLNLEGKINCCIHFNTNFKGLIKSMKHIVQLIDINTNKIVDQKLYIPSDNFILNSLTAREKEITRFILKG